jgi:hypothetical protein
MFTILVDGTPGTEFDLGALYAGTRTTFTVSVENSTSDSYTDLIATITDKEDYSTAKKTILGGNELQEGLAESYVQASRDGVIWSDLAGINSYIQLVDNGAEFAPTDIETFYIRFDIPANVRLNTQNLALMIRAQEYEEE